MKKYLFMLGDLPPEPSANGVCVQKVIKCLYKKEEDNVHCIVWSDQSVADYYPFHLHFIKGREKNQKHSYIVSLFKRIKYVLRKLFLVRYFPVSSLKIVKDFYNEAVKVIDSEAITHVIAVSFPGETILALNKLKKKYKNKIITCIYPLDVSLEGDRTRFKIWNRITQKYGKIMLADAIKKNDHALILENAKDSFLECVDKKYLDKLSFVGIPLIEKINRTDLDNKNDVPVLLYAGYLLPDTYNPMPVLSKIEKRLYRDGGKVIFDFYGVCDPALKREIINHFKHIEFKDNGWVTDEELNAAMSKADVYLNISKTKTNTIPSKIFKYMCFNKTIIHYYYVENDSCLPYLNKYLHSFLIKNDEINKVDDININELAKTKGEDDVETLFPTCTPNFTAKTIEGF